MALGTYNKPSKQDFWHITKVEQIISTQRLKNSQLSFKRDKKKTYYWTLLGVTMYLEDAAVWIATDFEACQYRRRKISKTVHRRQSRRSKPFIFTGQKMVSGGRDFSVKAAVGFCASSFALVPIHFINFLSLVCSSLPGYMDSHTQKC